MLETKIAFTIFKELFERSYLIFDVRNPNFPEVDMALTKAILSRNPTITYITILN